MRRICVYRVSALAVVFAGVAASGCATVSSLDVPWKTQTEHSSAEAPSQAEQNAADAARDKAAVDEATYWARKAVSASNQIAYARHLRSVTERNPELFAAKRDTSSNGTSSTGSSDGERGARSSAPSSSPQTRTVARNTDADEASGATSAPRPTPTSSDNSTRDAPAPPSGGSAQIRSVHRDIEKADGSRPDTWPVALGQTYGSTRRGYAPADPSLDTDIYDLSKAEARQSISKRFGIEPPDTEGAVAIPGTFLPPDKLEEFRDDEFNGFDGISEEQIQKQVAVVVPGKRITVYAGAERIASREFEADADLPSKLTAVRPVRLVDDGTIQLLAYWPESTDGETVRYKAGVLKVIGPFVGTLFEETVGERPSGDTDLRRTGYVDFVHDNEQLHIRWIPADEKGRPNFSRANVLEWNPWEGVFRVPEPPPTAPDQTS